MQLVLGLTGLPGAEIGLVKTILRLSSSLDAQWVVVEGGPCDVLLASEAAGAHAPVQPASAVLPISAAVRIPVLPRGHVGGAAGPALHRPIRAEELIELLNAESARSPATGTFAPAPAAAAAIAASAPQVSNGHARLRRWPPFALLQGKPAHTRLATFLSKNALSASRLSVLAARPLAECEAFLREMDAHNLLVWHAAATAAAVPAASHAPPRRGLLSTLREKLGIARSRA